jgi:hypothetical protein
MYHYSLLFPEQVREKVAVYVGEDPDRYSGIQEWAEDCYFRLGRPYRVHNLFRSPSWLARYRGDHPPAVREMMADVAAGRVEVEVRRHDDIDHLLSRPWYPIGVVGLKAADRGQRALVSLRRHARAVKRALVSKVDVEP